MSAKLFASAVEGLYSTDPCRYGYSADKNHASGYYPTHTPITKDEAEAVQDFLEANDILAENTRLLKSQADASVSFNLLIASAEQGWVPVLKTPPQLNLPGNPTISIQTGDHSDVLRKIMEELRLARSHVANEEQGLMVDALLESFRIGNSMAFKAA